MSTLQAVVIPFQKAGLQASILHPSVLEDSSPARVCSQGLNLRRGPSQVGSSVFGLCPHLSLALSFVLGAESTAPAGPAGKPAQCRLPTCGVCSAAARGLQKGPEAAFQPVSPQAGGLRAEALGPGGLLGAQQLWASPEGFSCWEWTVVLRAGSSSRRLIFLVDSAHLPWEGGLMSVCVTIQYLYRCYRISVYVSTCIVVCVCEYKYCVYVSICIVCV